MLITKTNPGRSNPSRHKRWPPQENIYGTKPTQLPQPTSFIVNSPMTFLARAPEWMQKLWRTTKWTNATLTKIIDAANSGSLLATGTGAIRNQWGAHYWAFSTTETLKRICTQNGPIDGNPNNMKAFRASATYILSALSILSTMEPCITNLKAPIELHTNCGGLLNLIQATTINRPSLVLSDHIDIVYQIRYIIRKTNLNISFTYTKAI